MAVSGHVGPRWQTHSDRSHQGAGVRYRLLDDMTDLGGSHGPDRGFM